MKKGKRLIFIAAAFAVLISCYFVIKSLTREKEEPVVPDEKVSIYHNEQATIENVEFTYEGKTYSFYKRVGEWYFSNDDTFPLDNDIIFAIEDYFLEGVEARKLPAAPDDLSEFGFDGSRRAALTNSEGGKFACMIGIQNPVTHEYYIKLDGDDAVYLADKDFGGLFEYDLLGLVKLDKLETVNSDNLTSLSVAKSGEEAELIYYENGYEGCYTPKYKWFALLPGDGRLALDTDKVVSLAKTANGISFEGCAAYNVTDQSELEKYGLGERAARISIAFNATSKDAKGDTVYTPRTFKLLVGSAMDDEHTYAMAEGSTIVAYVKTSALEKLMSIDIYALQPSDVCLLEHTTVNTMTISYNGQTHKYSISRKTMGVGSGDNSSSYQISATYYKDGAEITFDQFNKVFTAVTSLSSDGLGERPDGAPVITIVFERNTPDFTTMTLNLYKYNDSFYLAEFAGRADQLVSGRSIDALLSYVG